MLLIQNIYKPIATEIISVIITFVLNMITDGITHRFLLQGSAVRKGKPWCDPAYIAPYCPCTAVDEGNLKAEKKIHL